jgi:hypothetical protein
MKTTAHLLFVGSSVLLGGCFSPSGKTTESDDLTGSTTSGAGTTVSLEATSGTSGWPGTDSSTGSSTGSLCGDGAVDDDEECDDPDADNCSPSCMKTFRRVFVTSQRWTGENIGGIEGANAKCQAAADAVSLPGVYLAWLSSTESSPDLVFKKSSVPYLDLHDTEVAADWEGLTSELLKAPIFVTEKMDDPMSGMHPCLPAELVVVWSNTGTGGKLLNPATTCTGWSEITGDGGLGAAGYIDSTWTHGCAGSCQTVEAPLYCFEQ